jgi:dephospho-CoA kinase|tara:strand:+ start:443 stop:1069 length:627 start_codon:yes stop_codon:yes gene_type:complete
MKGFYNEMSVNEVLNNVNLIGIAGVAGSGKDTFAEIIKKVFESNGFEVNCLSFAKKLKEEVAEVSKSMYGIDTTNCTREEKNLIRPLLLAHGAIMREKTKGQYWIDGIKDLVSNDKINIITDVRFCEYECDEVDWIQSNNGIVVHITRFFEENGERIYISPDNEYEKRNNKILKNRANYSFSWPTDISKQIKYSNKFFEWLVKNYLER